MSEARQQAIHVVSDELGKTVNLARIALEDAVEGRSTRQALEKCADLLHEVGGVLKVVEIYGGALLSEEMEHTCRFLLQPRDKASMHEGLDALTRAMVQLPAYLERMVAGGRDVALVLLPLLNDLRAVRGQALLSESTILLLNRTPSEHVTVEQRGSAPSEDFVQLSRKVRPAFQLALLGLLKADQDSARPHLKKLRRMADALEQAAERDDVYRLWWVVGGVVDALLDGSLPISISIKRLLGQADRRIKRVIDAGLESFDKEPVADLLNSLLFYIARADEPGESVLAIRQAFGLTEPLPTQEEVDSVHGAMAGPSVALMQTVAAAIREDLTAVKDVLDVHMRTGEEDLGKLEPQIELLSKISDTLGVLGLGDARASVIAEVQKLRGMLVSGGGTPDHEALLSVAATLLSVEGSLERRLTQLVTPVEDTDRAPDSAEERQLGGVRSAVMRECIVNLARIKDTLTQAMEGKLDPVAVDAVPVLADGIQSGLSMLELTRARAVFAKLAAFVDTYLKAANQTLAADQLDRLADALVSVEYYMETIEAGRKEPGYMLDNAETCLSVLDDVRRDLERGAAEEAHEPTMVTRGLPAGAHSDTATVGDDLKGVHAPVVKNDTKNIDPELLELFIEEAKEEVRSIRRLLPQWHQDTADMDALITVRRSFHTLKGSGRMVGAERIGEYCWSIENLLNRVINRTLPVTPAMADFVADAAIAVPELIEQLETGIEPKIDVDLLALKAQAFADGDPKAADLTRASDVAAAPALEMDPVLYEIFAKEANGYLAAIGAFVDAADSTPAPITDAMHRACHTLHGSINTAGLDRAMPLSGALNQLARRVYDGRVGLDDDALALVNEAARTLDNIIHSVNDPVAEPPSVEDLTRRLEAKTAEIAHAQSTLVTEGINPPAEAVVDGSETDYEPTHVLTKLPGELQPVTAASELEAEENYDPEIAEIFTEEAAELLETADTALDAWSKRRDGDSLRELKRALHTLKGSANMAGIRAFGNLSHELETLLTALDDQRVNASTDIDHLLRHSFDTLHQMREVVLLGKQPSAMDDLEGTVRLAARGQIPAVDADAVPESETAPPVYRGLSTDELIEIPDEAPGIEDVTELDGELTGVLDAGSFNLDQVFTADTSGAEPGDSQLVDTMFGPHTETQQIGGGETAVDVAVGADGTAETPLDVDLEDMTGLEDTAITEGLDAQSLSSWSEPDDSNDDDEIGTQIMAEPQFGDNVIPISEAARDHTQGDDDVTVAAETTATDGDASDLDATDPSDTLIQASSELEKMIEDAAQRFGIDGEGDDDTLADAHAATIAAEHVAAAAGDVPDELPAAPEPEAPAATLPGRDTARERVDYARVDSRLLEDLLNAAGEISIFHGRLSQQVSTIDFHLAELGQTVVRLRDQLRQMEIETEAQILTRHEEEGHKADFDPLELDRYSTIQQLSRALAETSSDVDSLKDLLQNVTVEADTLLTQQSRVTTELQSGLMRTRMVPFRNHVARLERIVRQASSEIGKQASLAVEGASGELDRQVLEKMLGPLEHMMRNAVVHGIESQAERQAAGKPPAGQITIRLHREGAEMVIDIADDGRGLDVDAIRRKGIERGLIGAGSTLSNDAVVELILEPGFSTAESVTQAAGRGVGMDVVASEVKKLGGSLSMHSMPGQGTRFTVRLPFTLAITQALIVRCGEEVFALPLPTVEGVVRLMRKQVDRVLASDEKIFDYGEHSYRMRHLGPLVEGAAGRLPDDEEAAVAVILIRAGRYSTALLVDELLTSREIVVKSVGPQIAGIAGVSGATILGDGRVVLILDLPTLVRREQPLIDVAQRVDAEDEQPLVLVVDDSITVRRVTERFLKRNNFRVETARDGLDAVSVIQEQAPDLILLDIEMPRMDGFEFASHVRNDPRFAATPIIMITSRSGEKHRARAIEIGVNDYLGKPYQDHQLLQAIQYQLEEHGRLPGPGGGL